MEAIEAIFASKLWITFRQIKQLVVVCEYDRNNYYRYSSSFLERNTWYF